VNLTGPRSALIANICGVVVACVVAVEGHYIVQERLGIFRPFDLCGSFVPALVMFIVRGRIFSYCFLFLYIALSIQMFFQARIIYLGLYKWAGAKDPLGGLGIFFVVSLYCLAIYTAGALIWFVISLLESKK
jgi:hypothetical protein